MKPTATNTSSAPIKGRGATLNPGARFARAQSVPVDDGWTQAPADPDNDADRPPETWLAPEAARSVITRNQSPDIPFDRSINPYRGCEHGCIYCTVECCNVFTKVECGWFA
jgi:hypothetical protein